MKAKKKAIVITRFPFKSSWGGEESHTLTLAEHFRRKGFKVVFMGSCSVLLKKFQEKGFQTRKVWGGKMIVTSFELIKSFFLFPFIRWNLRKEFKKLCNEYEVLAIYSLSLNEKLFLTPFALFKKIQVVWVEHQEIRNWLLKNPWKWIYKKYAKKVKIIPISKKNEMVLWKELKIPKSSIHFIVNGVDVKKIQKEKRDTKKGMILIANRMISKKGMIDVFRAISGSNLDNKNIYILCLGDGEEKLNLEKYAKKNIHNARVDIKDFLKKEKWYEILSSADIFISSSRDSNETFSLNTAEAMAAGCKVVVTKCSGIADFLEDGVEAFFCNPSDQDDMMKKIQMALCAPEEMRKKAKERAKKAFDLEKMLQEYTSLIMK